MAVGVRGAGGRAIGVAVEVSLAATGLQMRGDEVGVRVAMGAAVACSSASPSSCIGDSPRTAECIKKSAPAPTAHMPANEASIAFVDTAPGGDALRDLEASSSRCNGGGGGVERLRSGFGTVQLRSSVWFIISVPPQSTSRAIVAGKLGWV